jgi:hypothetical protein
LTYDEAVKVCHKMNLPLPADKLSSYTLAELFNAKENQTSPKNKIGFI